MRGSFVDTAYWLASLVEDDQHHERAMVWSHLVSPPLITTQEILFEVADALSRPAVRELALGFLTEALGNPGIVVVQTDERLMHETIQLFRDRPDKGWSLTDCLSFVVMQQYNLTAALTSDRHFIQAGYRALLLEEPSEGSYG